MESFSCGKQTHQMECRCWKFSNPGLLANQSDLILEMVAFILTGLHPRTAVKELIVSTRGELNLCCIRLLCCIW